MKTIDVHIKRTGQSYPIIIKSGILGQCGRIIRQLCPPGNKRIAIITDRTVASLHLKQLQKTLVSVNLIPLVIIIPSGEAQKSLKRVQQIYNTLLKHCFERSDMIMALGGGVVGDIAGFVAATFMRGIKFVQIPTTLLAQVDAGLGGKAGINFQGKNIIGAFHQPCVVLIDPATLATLPPKEFYNGMAEVIKSATIKSPGLFKFLKQNKGNILKRKPDTLEEMIGLAARIKVGLIARDEREEKGIRTILNYGHTLGHALEEIGRYRSYRHGEAVAIGMTVAARISLKMGLTDKKLPESQTALLESYRLPTVLPRGIRWPALAAALKRDKKTTGGECRLVLPYRIGRAKLATVPMDIIRETIRSK